jgi:hypothetical protein
VRGRLDVLSTTGPGPQTTDPPGPEAVPGRPAARQRAKVRAGVRPPFFDMDEHKGRCDPLPAVYTGSRVLGLATRYAIRAALVPFETDRGS